MRTFIITMIIIHLLAALFSIIKSFMNGKQEDFCIGIIEIIIAIWGYNVL